MILNYRQNPVYTLTLNLDVYLDLDIMSLVPLCAVQMLARNTETTEEAMVLRLVPNGRSHKSTNGRPTWGRVKIVNLYFTMVRTPTCS